MCRGRRDFTDDSKFDSSRSRTPPSPRQPRAPRRHPGLAGSKYRRLFRASKPILDDFSKSGAIIAAQAAGQAIPPYDFRESWLGPLGHGIDSM